MRAIDADKLQKAIPAEEDNITGIGMTYDEMKAYNDGIDEQWKKIVNAPTIEPERKRGKWEYISKNSYTGGWRCSVCKKYALVVAVPLDHYGVHLDTKQELTDFCPNCGADLRGKKDE